MFVFLLFVLFFAAEGGVFELGDGRLVDVVRHDVDRVLGLVELALELGKLAPVVDLKKEQL